MQQFDHLQTVKYENGVILCHTRKPRDPCFGEFCKREGKSLLEKMSSNFSTQENYLKVSCTFLSLFLKKRQISIAKKPRERNQ